MLSFWGRTINEMELIYESISPYKNAGVYLFFIASRHPEYWKDKMPISERIESAGHWIGE